MTISVAGSRVEADERRMVRSVSAIDGPFQQRTVSLPPHWATKDKEPSAFCLGIFIRTKKKFVFVVALKTGRRRSQRNIAGLKECSVVTSLFGTARTEAPRSHALQQISRLETAPAVRRRQRQGAVEEEAADRRMEEEQGRQRPFG